MTKFCNNCSLQCRTKGHPENGCHVTVRRRAGRHIKLPHIGKEKFWDGVLTRSQLANQNRELVSKTKELEVQRLENLELKTKLNKIKENTAICVVCQDECLESRENSTPCGHVFHTGCLLGWLKNHNTCPCCRESLYDKPDVPEIVDMQSLVENVLTMHLNIEPESNETRELTSSMLYNLGDEISRLSVEHALDIDMDWFINFDNEEEEEMNEEETNEEEKQGEEIPIFLREEAMEILLNTDADGEEEIMDLIERRQRLLSSIDTILEETDDESSNMELDTPRTPEQVFEFPPLTPDPEPKFVMIYPETTLFEEWYKFGNVLSELRNKMRFRETQKKINKEMQSELAKKIIDTIGEEDFNKFQRLCGNFAREVINEDEFCVEAEKLLSINYLKEVWEQIIDSSVLPSWRKEILENVNTEMLGNVSRGEGFWV
jgi:hypothetical protein